MPKARAAVKNLDLTFSNLEKVLYPQARFTKAQVIEYYLRIAPVLLPHLEDRPVTLLRFPDGIHGESFYEKDSPGFTPNWVRRVPVRRQDPARPPIQYIVVDDARTLAWLANLACLELHPFLHRAPALDRPTHVVFDLDPGEGADVLSCAEVAFLLKEVLDGLRLEAFPKVSGSKGIQVYVPFNGPATYAVSRPFARAVADLLARSHPDRVVAEMARTLRGGKVFIDWSQNAEHKTTACAYSLRAKSERPFVSVPVRWEELRRALKKGNPAGLFWEAPRALARVERVGDLFAPVLRLKQKLPEEFIARPTHGAVRARSPASLGSYAAKRNFGRTREPEAAPVPRRSAQGSQRRFVVQQHAASHLHFDFRLEMHDVLKSWAVPKGMPLRDGETASAFVTEDHPLEYLQFEGIIPPGQYGGGTVMVWDIGTYALVEGNYWKGRLVVHLEGTKLNGAWTLERKEEQHGNSRWLLISTGGRTRRMPVRQREVSAVTGRSLEEIAAARSAIWNSHRSPAANAAPAAREPGRSARSRSAAPVFIQPMKATAADSLPEGREWLYEVKWDGYRALAAKHGREVRLLSMKNKPLTPDFPGVVEAVRRIRAETALLDGEIVALDPGGKPSFQALQNRGSLGSGWEIAYYAFDLLNLDGEVLTGLALETRRAKLRQVLAASGVRFSAELTGAPGAVAEAARAAGLEGIIAKRRDSAYRAGTRVETWRKLKLDRSQEFVLGGFNPNGETFQSLLAGYYEAGRLLFAGKVRQGFTPGSRARLMQAMGPHVSRTSPFANLPSSKKGNFGEGVTAEDMKKLIWLRPRLVAQCAFTEWTRYGLLRHATFLGLREDKDPREVRREVA